MKMSNKVYDTLKAIAQYVLPAIATFVGLIAGIWGWTYGEEIAASIMAVDTFLGVILGISTAQYNKTNSIKSDENTPNENNG